MSVWSWVGVAVAVWLVASVVVAFGLGALINLCKTRDAVWHVTAVTAGERGTSVDGDESTQVRALVITPGVPEAWVDEAWGSDLAVERRRLSEPASDATGTGLTASDNDFGRRERAEALAGRIVPDIDRLIGRGVLPSRVMSVDDVLDIVDLPVLVGLGDYDRDDVIRRVNEILRRRAS